MDMRCIQILVMIVLLVPSALCHGGQGPDLKILSINPRGESIHIEGITDPKSKLTFNKQPICVAPDGRFVIDFVRTGSKWSVLPCGRSAPVIFDDRIQWLLVANDSKGNKTVISNLKPARPN